MHSSNLPAEIPFPASSLNAVPIQTGSATRDNSSLRHALLDAAHVQRRLSGPRSLYRGDFEFARECFPLEIVSGDLAAFFECGGTRMAIAIGDIAGKGLAAAMWSPTLMCLLRARCSELHDAAEVLSAINTDLCYTQPDPPLTTLFLGFVDWKKKTLNYANAGHPTPFMIGSDLQARDLKDGGAVLGALPNARFSSHELTFRPGDTLVSFTDGASELWNEQGEEYGADRLRSAATKRPPESASEMLLSLIAELQDHAAGNRRSDDLTMLVVRRTA
jgi:sigma-B regulation protein RsbU (phosphoserine phosphatase)